LPIGRAAQIFLIIYFLIIYFFVVITAEAAVSW
jgi:hypothetical protein